MKIKLNLNEPIVVDTIRTALLENEKEYGAKYCPCSVEHTEDTICMCKEFKENPTMKRCHCGLYIRE